jgi:hypothetical protein
MVFDWDFARVTSLYMTIRERGNIVTYQVNSIIIDAATKPHDDEFYYGIWPE